MKKATVLLGFLLISVCIIGQSQRPRPVEKPERYVRKNATSPEAKDDLDAMADAFRIMRAMRCEDNRSWYYQGAIHNIPHKIIGANQLCPMYETDRDKLFAWADCTHTDQEASSLHFLLWHRMYTWHLEQIVRQLSGKEDFALPYWNYGSKRVAENRLPPQLVDPRNALYASARYSILNNGQPIDPTTVEDIQDELGLLAINPRFRGKLGFSQKLEGSPHGLMHDYIGADGKEVFFNEIYQDSLSGLMANVPSAGFDPVFWLHHSMVDRIWEQWDQSPYGKRPSLAELKAQPWGYNFIQANGDMITYTMDEVYEIVFNPDYVYDDLRRPVVATAEEVASPPVAERALAGQTPGETVVWRHQFGRAIEARDVFAHTVDHRKQARNFVRGLKKNTAGHDFILTLNVSVYKEIGDYYKVYLHFPGQEKEDQYIGMMTFFGVGHVHGIGEAHSFEEEGANLDYTYDIPDGLIHANEPFEVRLEKRGPSSDKVTLEAITLSAIH